jgi:hypothetical protein
MKTNAAIRWLIACGLAVVAGLALESFVIRLGGASFLANDSGHGVVQLENSRHDFGTVRKGQNLEATFPLRNSGSQRLLIRKLSASCECLSGPTVEAILQPKETEPLTVHLDTTKATGHLESKLTYHTSDPDCPVLTLTVSADITP